MPPATNVIVNGEDNQGQECVTTQESGAKLCAMHEDHWSNNQCENVAVDGSEFCAEHAGVKLCKASGIQYQFEGNREILWLHTIPPHPVDPHKERTKRATFCGDRCKNLWRDTKQSRERQNEVRKIENGERSERYALISNYCSTGQRVIFDKHTGRVVDRSM